MYVDVVFCLVDLCPNQGQGGAEVSEGNRK